jgi:hypothetical protein
MEETRDIIKVPVIAFEQKGVRNYVGVMKARDILDVWHVERFIENQVFSRGYQRGEEEERMREVYRYIEECQLPIVPAILASVRKGARFLQKSENAGMLEIPRAYGVLEVIDGQHRVGGFNVIKRLLEGEKIGRKKPVEEEVKKLDELLDFDVPVHFIDSESAVERMRSLVTAEQKEDMLRELDKKELDNDDVERVHFFVINKTQKAIRASLKDTLAYLIHSSGIRGIPIIEKEVWRAKIATPLTLDLHFNSDSPLKGMLNISGARGLDRPVQLASYVMSLKRLATNDNFTNLSKEQRYAFLKAYWSTIAKSIPAAFDKDTYKEFLILRSLGVRALNYLASDILDWCMTKGIELPSDRDIEKYTKPLNKFDWKRGTSPIAAFGGEKGAQEAYKRLLLLLGENGVQEATRKYEELSKEE